MMKNYELTYLISPDVSEQELKDIQEKINSFLQKEGGILGQIIGPIKKNLAYPIKKITDAFLVSLFFELAPENLEKIDKEIKKDSAILRYLLISRPKVKKISVLRKKKLIKPETAKPKVELKEIEKKLEEILE